jgi:hypothetical protein
MVLKRIITLLLCCSLVFLATGLVCAAPANPDNDDNTEANVITESDAGGGGLSGKEVGLLIIVAILITAIVIVAIVV